MQIIIMFLFDLLLTLTPLGCSFALVPTFTQWADDESHKIVYNKKKLLQHESITPIESGITLSLILQIQNEKD